MSAYITLLTPMTDRECLVDALTDVGYDRNVIEVHDTPSHLVGFGSDVRSQTANIVIRRQHFGPASNDIGFLETPLGYQFVTSQADGVRHGADWLRRLHKQYAIYAAAKEARLAAEERRRREEERIRLVEAQTKSVIAKAKKLGYQVKETREGEVVRLVLVKRSY